MTRKQIERKYGVKIVENGYYPFYGKYVKLYDMYSADGCRWDTGFLTIKGVEQECKKWEKELLDIKESAYIAEIMKQKADLGIECPKIESIEIVYIHKEA